MKYLFVLLLLTSCYVERHGSKEPEYMQATLISKPERTMYGTKLLFLTSSGDTVKRYEQKKQNWQIGNCYLIIK